MSTSRKGFYVCGVFQGPKDIPQSVMEASAAASASTELLSPARGSMVRVKELPPELDVSGQQPRIGVFVCNCGINIGGIADVPAVREYAKTLPYVVHVEDNLFTCSQDTQDRMKKTIQEKGINRVVVASCSPRTHEPLFQETIRDAGLNKYLFEMANIRDQNTWVHMKEPQKATDKAKDLVRMAVAKAALVEPLQQVMLPVTKSALVVGGGIAGMEAALGVAEQGYKAYLVERSSELGGVARRLRSTWKGEEVEGYLKALIEKVKGHPMIEVFMGARSQADFRYPRQLHHHHPERERGGPCHRRARGGHPRHRRTGLHAYGVPVRAEPPGAHPAGSGRGNKTRGQRAPRGATPWSSCSASGRESRKDPTAARSAAPIPWKAPSP